MTLIGAVVHYVALFSEGFKSVWILLGPLAKLGKTSTRFVMSVCLSALPPEATRVPPDGLP